MTSSMLASPQGASEQYMKTLMPSRMVKDWWPKAEDISVGVRHRSTGESFDGEEDKVLASSRRYWLKDRIATISACQS